MVAAKGSISPDLIPNSKPHLYADYYHVFNNLFNQSWQLYDNSSQFRHYKTVILSKDSIKLI